MSPGSCSCAHDTRGVGPAAASLLDYLAERGELIDALPRPMAMSEDLFEELLERTRGARRSFHALAAPVVRRARLRATTGELHADYEQALQRLAGRQPTSLLELIDGVLSEGEVRAQIDRVGPSQRSVEFARKRIEALDATVQVRSGRLVIVTGDRRLTVSDDVAASRDPATSDLLAMLARTWAVHGRGFATVVPDPEATGGHPKSIGIAQGFAHGLVAAAWEFDRDVRELEDTGGAAAIGGQEVAFWLGVTVAAGMILIAIADCVEEPWLKAFLIILGLILTIVGIIALADSGVPVTACRRDPDTGIEYCGTI